MSITQAPPRPAVAELRATIGLALPLIVGQLCAIGQGVVEVMLAGHLNAHTLGAVAIGSNVWVLALMAINGLMYAVPPHVAQLDGAGRRNVTAPVFRQAVWLALFAGTALGVLLWFGGPLLVAMSAPSAELARDADAYIRATAAGTPAVGVFFACRGLAAGLSATRLPMVFSLLGLVLLGPVGFLLVFGGLGLPSLGAFGSGLAGTIVNVVQGVAFVLWLRFSRRFRDVGWGTGRRGPDIRVMLALFRLGAPMAVSVLLEVGLFTFAALAIGRLGETAAASHQVAINVAAVAFMVPLGLSMAITVRVGNAVGRRDPGGVRRAGFCGFGLALGFELVSMTILFTAPLTIAGLYTDDPGVVAGAAALLLIAAVFQLSDGAQVACIGALRGLKDTRVPMLITAFAYWVVGMPAGLALAFTGGLGPQGMWIGLTAGLTVAAVLLFARFALLSERAVRRS